MTRVFPRPEPSAGTSLTGQTVNGAVVFDFTRHMDRIAELTPMRHTARVEPQPHRCRW